MGQACTKNDRAGTQARPCFLRILYGPRGHCDASGISGA